MMNRLGIKITTTVQVAKLQGILQENRENHGAIVAEARKGYVDKAKKALNAKLDKLASGKIVGLTFHLQPPKDYTDAYDTVINMLEMTTDTSVTLGPDEFRCLVQDEWDWSDSFLLSNSGYSTSAMVAARGKGLV